MRRAARCAVRPASSPLEINRTQDHKKQMKFSGRDHAGLLIGPGAPGQSIQVHFDVVAQCHHRYRNVGF